MLTQRASTSSAARSPSEPSIRIPATRPAMNTTASTKTARTIAEMT